MVIILFLNEDRGIHFHLVVQPSHIFIMHSDTACRHIFPDGVRVVISMNGISVANPAIDLHIDSEPAVTERVARIATLDPFLVVRSVLYFFVDFEQAFRCIRRFSSCSHRVAFDDFSFLVVGQLVRGFVDNDKLRILGVLTVQLLSRGAMQEGGKEEDEQQDKGKYAADGLYNVRSPHFVLPHIYAGKRES